MFARVDTRVQQDAHVCVLVARARGVYRAALLRIADYLNA